jgi:hypothetical protein
VDRPQTAGDRFVSLFGPYFTVTTMPFGFHFRFQSADVVSYQSEKCCCRFSVLPTPPPLLLEPSGTVAAAAEADPVDFEAMASEQNRCAETQRLLIGSSLKLVFRQAGAQRLVGDVSTGVFRPIVHQQNSKNTFFCICTAFTTLGDWPLGASCLLGLSGAASPTMSPAGKILPALPKEQDPPPHLPAITAHPHSPAAVCSSPY